MYNAPAGAWDKLRASTFVHPPFPRCGHLRTNSVRSLPHIQSFRSNTTRAVCSRSGSQGANAAAWEAADRRSMSAVVPRLLGQSQQCCYLCYSGRGTLFAHAVGDFGQRGFQLTSCSGALRRIVHLLELVIKHA